MSQRAARSAVLCVLALCLLSGCGGGDGQEGTERPSVTASVTASLSPTRTLPNPTASPEVPDQTESESEPAPRPSRSLTQSPDKTTPPPAPPSTRDPQPESAGTDGAHLDGDRGAGPGDDVDGPVGLAVGLAVAVTCCR